MSRAWCESVKEVRRNGSSSRRVVDNREARDAVGV